MLYLFIIVRPLFQTDNFASSDDGDGRDWELVGKIGVVVNNIRGIVASVCRCCRSIPYLIICMPLGNCYQLNSTEVIN